MKHLKVIHHLVVCLNEKELEDMRDTWDHMDQWDVRGEGGSLLEFIRLVCGDKFKEDRKY